MLPTPDDPSDSSSPPIAGLTSNVSYVLGMLTDEDVDWLASHGARWEVADEEVLVGHGKPCQALFVVLEGKLQLESTPDEPTYLGRGDLFGEAHLLNGATVDGRLKARGAGVVFAVPYTELDSKLNLDVDFASRLYRALAVIVAHRSATPSALGLVGPTPAHPINTYLADDRMRRLLNRMDVVDDIVITGRDLTVEQIARAAWQHANVGVAQGARRQMQRSRQIVDRLAAGDAPIYGVTTNVGALKDHRISDGEQPSFQRRILLSHAAGVGPEHPTDVVRAIMLARLNGMARGGAGVQPAVFEALLAMLNSGVHPVVPRCGSIGMSDLVPLAHLALPLVGEGRAEYQGKQLAGGVAMALAGIALPRLMAKDGLALVSANSASVGHGALVIVRCRDVLALADVAASMSLEALVGHTTMLDQQVDRARRFTGQLLSAQQMRMLLEGSSLWSATPTLGVQDPISFRSAIQVHGAVLDVLDGVRSTLETELNSTGDNPMVLVDRGEIVADGNFHPAGVAIAFDSLAIGLSQLANMAANRVVRLMDPQFTALTPYLSASPDRSVGLGVLQKTVTALNGQVRVAANPACLDYVPVADMMEDHATMAVECVAKAAASVDAIFDILAIELLVAAQAIDLRGDLTLGAGTAAAHHLLRQHAPVFSDDRLMAPEIAAVRRLIDDGSLLRAASGAIGYQLGTNLPPFPQRTSEELG